MKLTEFDYTLPKELIAQHPSSGRGDSRLMVLDRRKETISHDSFSNFPDYLSEGDVLLLNNTKVFSARLVGVKKKSGGKVELLLVRKKEFGYWNAMIKSSGKLKENMEIHLNDDTFVQLIEKENETGLWLIRFKGDENVDYFIEKNGFVPLPPYIKREDKELEARDKERYQTVYASKKGAVAAPTAGLHFTQEILKRIREKGVEIAEITLHVGPGTFKPVKAEFIEQHFMDPEYFEISTSSEKIISKAIREKRRIVSVGTTTVRTIESINRPGGSNQIEPPFWRSDEKTSPISGYTDLFIYPGFKFRYVGSLLTNFHLPKSTLLMLVSAFAGKGFTQRAYQEAIRGKYRFYSYGDAMLVL